MDLPVHGSPAFIAARKGHETGRLVVDFRHYNKQIIPPVYNLPRIDDILAELSSQKGGFFGGADLATGYFLATLHDDAR